MDLINLLPKFKIVEVNKLAGLLNGHIVAQAAYETEATYVENGQIFYLGINGDVVAHADATFKAQPFLHYTEELLPFMNGNEYFAVEVDGGVAYPRLIGLYEGDEFTTNNIANLATFDDWDANKAWAIVDEDALTLVDGLPAEYDGPLFRAEKDRLAAGQPAARLTLLAKQAIVAAGE
jgi:hypothetical protein